MYNEHSCRKYILCEKHHISEQTMKVVKLGDKEYAISKSGAIL